MQDREPTYCEKCGQPKEYSSVPLCKKCYFEKYPKKIDNRPTCKICGEKFTPFKNYYQFCEDCYQSKVKQKPIYPIQ